MEHFEVRQAGLKGQGLFALQQFSTGEALFPFDYWSSDHQPLHFTNHSCEPNAQLESNVFVAVREIGCGEEITYDYGSFRIPASPWNFACHCGSEVCRGQVVEVS